jgi:hypothetical protein
VSVLADDERLTKRLEARLKAAESSLMQAFELFGVEYLPPLGDTRSLGKSLQHLLARLILLARQTKRWLLGSQGHEAATWALTGSSRAESASADTAKGVKCTAGPPLRLFLELSTAAPGKAGLRCGSRSREAEPLGLGRAGAHITKSRKVFASRSFHF